MGNAATIYDDKCLVYSVDKLGSCPVYEEHLETMRFITQTGKVLEKTVYQNFNVDTLPDKLRISWFQLYGHCLKNGGTALPESDPYRDNILQAGKAEKLIGQMENEFSTIVNSLILKNIQELRLYHQYVIVNLYGIFQKYSMALSADEEKTARFEKGSDILMNHRTEFKNIHSDLHEKVINVYEALNKLKNYIPAIIEAQIRANTYANNYLEHVLENIKMNKKVKNNIIPLSSVDSELTYDVPDYRRAVYGDDFNPNEFDPNNYQGNGQTKNSVNPQTSSSGGRQSRKHLNMNPNDVDADSYQGNQKMKNSINPQKPMNSEYNDGNQQHQRPLNGNPNDPGSYNGKGSRKMKNSPNQQSSTNSELNDGSRQYQRGNPNDIIPGYYHGNEKMKNSINPQDPSNSELKDGVQRKPIKNSVIDDIVKRIENRQFIGNELTGIPYNRHTRSISETTGLPNQRDSPSIRDPAVTPNQKRAKSSNEVVLVPDQQDNGYEEKPRQKPVKTCCGGSRTPDQKQKKHHHGSLHNDSSVKTSCTSSSSSPLHPHHKHNNRGKTNSIRGDVSKNQNFSKSEKKVEIDAQTKYLNTLSERNDQVETDKLKLDSLSTSSLKLKELKPAHY